MSKCINCKYWNRGRNKESVPAVANCMKLSMTVPEEGVLVDMDGIYDEIGWEGEELYVTGKNFGCIYFKEKETTT